MAIPLIPVIAGVLGGSALGYYGSGAGELKGGLLEIGTTKKLDKYNISTQDSYTYSPTYTTTQTYNPIETFSPNYSFNPMTAIGSGEFNFTKKEAYSQALNPSWDMPVSVKPSTSTTQTAEQSQGSGSNILDTVKQFALLGVIGIIVYKVVITK